MFEVVLVCHRGVWPEVYGPFDGVRDADAFFRGEHFDKCEPAEGYPDEHSLAKLVAPEGR